MSSESTYLTVAEIAAELRASKMTVYRLIHSGTLPAIQIGRAFRVSVDAFDVYVQDAAVTPTKR